MKHRADTVALDDGARGVGHAPGRHAVVEPEEPLELPLEGALGHGEWRGRSLGRAVLGVAAVAALGPIVPAAVTYWHGRADDQLEVLMVVVTFALGLWSILVSCPPQLVTLRGSTLRVHGPRVEETFDLADALLRVELSGRPGRRDWRLRLGRPDDRDLVLARRHVDSATLDLVVRHHRGLAERRRHREWARLGL
jgi:hypothetical protein